MSEVRIIKKYPNRRLYDTDISRYITLEEIRQLVLQGIKFRVEDKSNNADITRSILLQVIAEQEEGGGNPIFTTETLQFIIRYYGDPLQTSISRYLELSARLFHEQQQQFTDQLRQMLGQAQQPLTILRELADRQVPIWRSVRRELLKNLASKTRTLKRRSSHESPSENSTGS